MYHEILLLHRRWQWLLAVIRYRVMLSLISLYPSSEKVKDFVLCKILRGRKKLRLKKFESVKENFLVAIDDYYFIIHRDEKLLKSGKVLK